LITKDSKATKRFAPEDGLGHRWENTAEQLEAWRTRSTSPLCPGAPDGPHLYGGRLSSLCSPAYIALELISVVLEN